MLGGDVGRAFSRLAAASTQATDEGAAVAQDQKQQRSAEAERLLATNEAPKTTEQCIIWILKCWEKKDYFRCADRA